jgi:hypothetical protein
VTGGGKAGIIPNRRRTLSLDFAAPDRATWFSALGTPASGLSVHCSHRGQIPISPIVITDSEWSAVLCVGHQLRRKPQATTRNIAALNHGHHRRIAEEFLNVGLEVFKDVEGVRYCERSVGPAPNRRPALHFAKMRDVAALGKTPTSFRSLISAWAAVEIDAIQLIKVHLLADGIISVCKKDVGMS